MDAFLTDDDREILIFKKYPEVEKIFRQYIIALPSSAAVERLFTQGGGIFEKKRHQMSDLHFEQQLLLKLNNSFY